MDETWEDILKDPLCSCEKQLSNVKKKKISLPTYPPADSVGWQCQTNNILRVASLKKKNKKNLINNSIRLDAK